ncbi:EthD domain-containing protein [Sphingomonas montanisoli]|nr:EthD domain-containing protein [Sphingomonas montanisoli]
MGRRRDRRYAGLMIKIISLLRRNPKLTPDEFRAYWRDTHVPLVRSLLPGLRHYEGCFPVDGALDGYDAHAIVELAFDDRETMEREMNSDAFLSEERVRSSAHLLDLNSVRNILVETEDALKL